MPRYKEQHSIYVEAQSVADGINTLEIWIKHGFLAVRQIVKWNNDVWCKVATCFFNLQVQMEIVSICQNA